MFCGRYGVADMVACALRHSLLVFMFSLPRGLVVDM